MGRRGGRKGRGERGWVGEGERWGGGEMGRGSGERGEREIGEMGESGRWGGEREGGRGRMCPKTKE